MGAFFGVFLQQGLFLMCLRPFQKKSVCVLLLMLMSHAPASARIQFGLFVTSSAQIPDTVGTREYLLAALVPTSIGLYAWSTDGPLSLNAWETTISGWATTDPGVFLTPTALHPPTALNVGSGLGFSVGLGDCVTVPADSLVLLAEFQALSTTAFDVGSLHLDGYDGASYPKVADCAGKVHDVRDLSHLLFKNAATYDSTRFDPRPGWPGDCHPTFPPTYLSVMAGIATVTEFRTPLYTTLGHMPYSEAILDVAVPLVNCSAGPATLVSLGAIYPFEDRNEFVAGDGTALQYLKTGETIVFIAAREPDDFYKVYPDRFDGRYYLMFSRRILSDPAITSQPTFEQEAWSIPPMTGANHFKSGLFDDTLITQVLVDAGTTLQELSNEIQGFYQAP